MLRAVGGKSCAEVVGRQIKTMKIVVFSFFSLIAFVAAPPPPYSDHCIVGEENVYPGKVTAPWYTISLDDDPSVRWNEVSRDYANQIGELIHVINLYEAL